MLNYKTQQTVVNLPFSKGSKSEAIWHHRLFPVFTGVVLHDHEACECQTCSFISETYMIAFWGNGSSDWSLCTLNCM